MGIAIRDRITQRVWVGTGRFPLHPDLMRQAEIELGLDPRAPLPAPCAVPIVGIAKKDPQFECGFLDDHGQFI
jgi:hypothetical protein